MSGGARGGARLRACRFAPGLRPRACALATALLCLASSGCFLEAWKAEGLRYACSDAGSCPDGFLCDDGVCCQPGGAPACPTQPTDGVCPDGSRPVTYYADADRDGFGNPAVTQAFCTLPVLTSWALDPRDCDDTNPTIKPTAVEACNGRDDNCNDLIDEGLTPRTTWYRDVDGDGYGETSTAVLACASPPGYVDRAGDCAPTDPQRFPGAKERCNGLDDNCDGRIDEGPFSDAFNPGLSQPTEFACSNAGLGLCLAGNQQCRGGALACVAQRAPENDVCDGLDNDCDGLADDQPGCGGPAALLRARARMGAQRLQVASFSDLTGRCARGYAAVDAGVAMTWLSPSWAFSTPKMQNQNQDPGAPGFFFAHLWWMEAAAGEAWDLSGPAAKLHLAMSFVAINAADAGAPTVDLFGTAARHLQPQVTLCDAQGQVVRQYLPQAAPLTGNASSWDGVIPLAGGGGWSVTGAGALQRVTRVEVVLSTRAPEPTAIYPQTTVNVTFGADAGFFGGNP